MFIMLLVSFQVNLCLVIINVHCKFLNVHVMGIPVYDEKLTVSVTKTHKAADFILMVFIFHVIFFVGEWICLH